MGNFISLRTPLAAPIPSSNVIYISESSAFTTQCPGFGKAAAGYFCIYEGDQNDADSVGFGKPYYMTGQKSYGEGVGPDGATIFASTSGSTATAYADGVWAVTAP